MKPLTCWLGQHDDAIAALRDRLAALERELAEARNHDVREMCITEAASWSNSIAEYCKHWEGRAEKAEAALAALRQRHAEAVERAYVEAAMRFAPHTTDINFAWLASEAKKGVST